MGAIITLGNQRDERAALPLAQCALRHPIDIVQNLEILRSLRKLPCGTGRDAALAMLQNHPSRPIRDRSRCIDHSRGRPAGRR